LSGYAGTMNVNPVRNCTLIIRSQAEYSAATQAVVMRYILETPATGERCGFTDAETLLAILRAELDEFQNQTMPRDPKQKKP